LTQKILVIIPAYNEEETIEAVVLGAKKHGDVCVVNDCSSDKTLAILNDIPDIHVINHKENTHIPGSILDGMKHAVKLNYRYAITMDAGLSHNPDEITRFVAHPHSDLAIGTRVAKTNTTIMRILLSCVGNFVYNMSLNFPMSAFKRPYYKDITSGYRRYSNEAMRHILSKKTHSKSFDILFETTMFVYKNKMVISQVPITYNFSNSSLNLAVVKDCILMCLKSIARQINPAIIK